MKSETNKLPEHFNTKQGKFDRGWNFTHEYYNHIRNTYRKIDNERDRQIIKLCFIDDNSTYEALKIIMDMSDEQQKMFYSNQGKLLSIRRIQQIIDEYYPDYRDNVIELRKKSREANKKVRPLRGNYQDVIKECTAIKNCSFCGETQNLEIHHMIPVSMNGTSDSRNLIYLCNDCHKKVTNYQINLQNHLHHSQV